VPPEFADHYPVMQTDLTNFEATVDAGWNGVLDEEFLLCMVKAGH
jgi:hypothetical protein